MTVGTKTDHVPKSADRLFPNKKGIFTRLRVIPIEQKGEMDKVDQRIKLKTSKPKLGRGEALGWC